MKNIVTFQKIVSYSSIGLFFLVTILFFSSYTSLKKERRTKWRLYHCSKFLAIEKAATNTYPHSLRCLVDNDYKIEDGNGNLFKYESINDGEDYVLFSVGQDGIPYTEDDVHATKYDLSND